MPRASTAGYAILALALAAHSSAQARSVVTDPVAPGVVQCAFYVDLAPRVTLPVVATEQGNVCRLEIDTLGPGPHAISVAAISAGDSPWGHRESLPTQPMVLQAAIGPEAPAPAGADPAVRAVPARTWWLLVPALVATAALAAFVWFHGRQRSRRRRGASRR